MRLGISSRGNAPVATPSEPDSCGKLVRDTWVSWAQEQPDPKPSWLTSWDDLDEGQREVDTRIGMAITAAEQDRLRPVLTDALEGLLDMFGYVPEFFREKWEHQGYIDRLAAALTSLNPYLSDGSAGTDVPVAAAPGRGGVTKAKGAS